MDRNSLKPSEVLSANANGRRSSAQLFGSRPNSRKGMENPELKENMDTATSDTEGGYRPPVSGGNSYSHQRSHTIASATKPSDYKLRQSGSIGRASAGHTGDSSPRDTRIPRPKTTAPLNSTVQNSPSQYSRSQKQPSALRQPMSLKSAFKLAQEQEAEDGTIDLNRAFNMASAEANGGIDASPSPAPRTYRARHEGNDMEPQNTHWSRRGSELGQQLQRFDRNHQLSRGSGPLGGLFANNRAGPNVSETSHAFARKSSSSSSSSIGTSPGIRETDQWNATPTRNKGRQVPLGSTTPGGEPVRLGIGRQDNPIPSIELKSATSEEFPSPVSQADNISPEKSLNWHLDADFTAGDLQISDSPRIRTWKAGGGSAPLSLEGSNQNQRTPAFRRSNSRLDQIREREAEVERIPLPEDALSPPVRRNTKLDEIGAREREALSKRAVATSRLDEIRMKNSETRSESQEIDRQSSNDGIRNPPSLSHKPMDIPESKLAQGPEKEAPRDPPGSNSTRSLTERKSGQTEAHDDVSAKDNKVVRDPSSQDDSQELLRRLARATSASPPPPVGSDNIGGRLPIAETTFKPKLEETEISRPHSTREERRSRNLEIKSSRERPSVGFVGLKRVASSDSLHDKRASKANSEIDPTDRIEGEMKLFAPLDNYSEKGSVRAPSPLTSEPAEEETPRPNRVDPLTLPTPRVTGAFVETPATTRVKEDDDLSDKVASDSILQTSEALHRAREQGSFKAPVQRTVKREGRDGPTSAGVSKARSSSVPTARRSRSACGRRRRPLINTAKPASAKEDLRAILRSHEIDDSTLEDFDERLARHEIDHEELERMVEESTLKAEDDPNAPELADSEREVEPYTRMSKSLKNLLTDIRSAKQGIERLEDRVAHSEHKAPKASTGLEASKPQPPPCLESGAILISMPRLWRRDPKFKLTPLGILSIFLAIWWPLELLFSHQYAVEYACTPTVPCDWSPNEPYYPYTMPFMLDEWVTGGKGREWIFWIGEELGDLAAEASDWITNTDFTQYDERYMDVWERKRHRRRLRKHGLIQKWVQPPGYKSMYAEWEAVRRAREEAEESGYGAEDESMSADESVRW
ncbi:hypothetical protein DL766_004279 [Monosporascus sp. MC13-8B]|nr:hypothetical protein DL763_002111 [Monosporascus cannonballus]RYP31737.1 hypothetical protein DL766_004279 [Monosporascus sp. MC13-8B]